MCRSVLPKQAAQWLSDDERVPRPFDWCSMHSVALMLRCLLPSAAPTPAAHSQASSSCRGTTKPCVQRGLRLRAGHHGPVLGVHRHPLFPNYFLSVGDWCTKLWSEDLRTPVVEGPYQASYLTTARWSPTRCVPHTGSSRRSHQAAPRRTPLGRLTVCGRPGGPQAHMRSAAASTGNEQQKPLCLPASLHSDVTPLLQAGRVLCGAGRRLPGRVGLLRHAGLTHPFAAGGRHLLRRKQEAGCPGREHMTQLPYELAHSNATPLHFCSCTIQARQRALIPSLGVLFPRGAAPTLSRKNFCSNSA